MNYTLIEIITSPAENEAGHDWETLLPPSNQQLFEAIKPSVKRLSLCELAIMLSVLFRLGVLIVTDDHQPANRL